ncbi:MAG TPA: hypothetical protein VD908_07760 [Cytophagales bacterium]|nr:hypothetical protein [Cytophagales bacterium]
MNKERYIRNKWCKMWVDEDILYITYFKNTIIDLAAAEKVLEDRLSISEGKSYLIQGDCRGVKYWTRQAREFQSTEQNNRLVKAGTVIYTEHYVLNVICNFFLKFNKLWVPTKFFCNEKEALEWLEKYR